MIFPVEINSRGVKSPLDDAEMKEQIKSIMKIGEDNDSSKDAMRLNSLFDDIAPQMREKILFDKALKKLISYAKVNRVPVEL